MSNGTNAEILEQMLGSDKQRSILEIMSDSGMPPEDRLILEDWVAKCVTINLLRWVDTGIEQEELDYWKEVQSEMQSEFKNRVGESLTAVENVCEVH